MQKTANALAFLFSVWFAQNAFAQAAVPLISGLPAAATKSTEPAPVVSKPTAQGPAAAPQAANTLNSGLPAAAAKSAQPAPVVSKPTAQGPAAAPPSARTGLDMPATVGELVRLEAEKALEEARKAAQAGAPAVSPPSMFAAARPTSVVNTDVVELLGAYSRSGVFSADLAINGIVKQVQKGDTAGSYEVTGIAQHCIHLLDAKKAPMLRCIAAAND